MQSDVSGLRQSAMVLLVAGILLVSCARKEPATAEFRESALPVPTDSSLAAGQTVYRADCANCHNVGKKGAPRVGDTAAWAPRLTQGIDTLITHATRGYLGPAGDEMPARGGNDDLTDDQVAAAVRYMVSLAP